MTQTLTDADVDKKDFIMDIIIKAELALMKDDGEVAQECLREIIEQGMTELNDQN